MTFKTYLVVYFGTNGIGPSEIARLIEGLGFKTLFGPYDFAHPWNREPSKSEILALGDRVQTALQGTGSVFNLDTHE